MVAFLIVAVLIGVTYYLSRRSNRKAVELLRSGVSNGRRRSPAELARLELMRAEHAAQAGAAQTDNHLGSIG